MNPSNAIREFVLNDHPAGSLRIRVATPTSCAPRQASRTLYVLPVGGEFGEGKWGCGVRRCVERGIHDRFDLVLVMPEFRGVPWYGDHPTDPSMRQETYFLKRVIPWVEDNLPVAAEPEARLLLGFSKSGWGAFSLIFRNPDVFGYAAAWDAPLMLQACHMGMQSVFDTQETGSGIGVRDFTQHDFAPRLALPATEALTPANFTPLCAENPLAGSGVLTITKRDAPIYEPS